MGWREKTISRILLLVARMLSDDASLTRELETLATHIQVTAPE